MVSVYHPASVKGAEIFVDPISAYGCLDLYIFVYIHSSPRAHIPYRFLFWSENSNRMYQYMALKPINAIVCNCNVKRSKRALKTYRTRHGL